MARNINPVQNAHEIGKQFSRHVHGIFVHPRATIRRIVAEGNDYLDITAPGLIVIVAALLTAIGTTIWNIALTSSLLAAFFETVIFFVKLVVYPVWFLFVWAIWILIFHFLGSIISGKDLFDLYLLKRTAKLAGVSMAPLFLNLLPYFIYVTPLWVWVLSTWSMEVNYGTSLKGALVITLPMLFVTVIKLMSVFGGV